jgi:hypothetical protein
MNIPGLDYNTQREKLIMPEYGREVQKMVDYCMTIADRKERLNCAYTIIDTMMRMNPQLTQTDNYEQKLWDQLAVISDFKLDIDWPVDVSKAKVINEKPQPVKHETGRIPVRHYGRMVFELFDKLKTMEPGPQRDELTALTANQMKRDLVQWGHGLADDEKVADDLARFTDGKIQLDLNHFQFEHVNAQPLPAANNGGKKRKKK